MSFLLARTDSLSGADFGKHSVRYGAALAMYLSGTPVVHIMLQGCWSLDAFLVYIKRQVVELSLGISANMVQNNDFTILPRVHTPLPCTGKNRLFLNTAPSNVILRPLYVSASAIDGECWV